MQVLLPSLIVREGETKSRRFSVSHGLIPRGDSRWLISPLSPRGDVPMVCRKCCIELHVLRHA